MRRSRPLGGTWWRSIRAERGRECAIVADELGLVRAGIAAVLEARGIEVVAQTRSGRELVSLATVDRPDLVVVGAPADLDVADVVRRLVRLRPHPGSSCCCRPRTSTSCAICSRSAQPGIALRTVDADELGVGRSTRARKGDRYVVAALHGALTGAVALPALDDRTDDVLTLARTRGARAARRGPHQP